VATIGQRPLRVSERLKLARETRNVSHRQIADATKLSVHVIRALEEERASALPPGIYRRALVRAIASEVGLDPEATLRDYLTEWPDDLPVPGQPATVVEPVARSGSWRRLFAMFGAVVPVLAGIAYFGLSSTVPADAPDESGRADGSRLARPEVVRAGGFTSSTAARLLPVTMLITVSSACELRVVADGELVVTRALAPGESLQVAFSDDLELSGSNAGAVQYSINGRAGRMLGTAGEPLSARIGRDDYHIFLSGR